MIRTCSDRHPHPPSTAAGCRLCWLVVNDERYRRLWNEHPDAPPTGGTLAGYVFDCRECKNRDVWDWVIRRDGVVVASGREPTREDAQREMDAEFELLKNQRQS